MSRLLSPLPPCVFLSATLSRLDARGRSLREKKEKAGALRERDRALTPAKPRPRLSSTSKCDASRGGPTPAFHLASPDASRALCKTNRSKHDSRVAQRPGVGIHHEHLLLFSVS